MEPPVDGKPLGNSVEGRRTHNASRQILATHTTPSYFKNNMIHPAYEEFKKLKKSQKDALVLSRSRVTLEWYEEIGKMLEDPIYEYSYDFLTSISTFIETKEYITDKQIEAIQNIIGQTMDYSNGKNPF